MFIYLPSDIQTKHIIEANRYVISFKKIFHILIKIKTVTNNNVTNYKKIKHLKKRNGCGFNVTALPALHQLNIISFLCWVILHLQFRGQLEHAVVFTFTNRLSHSRADQWIREYLMTALVRVECWPSVGISLWVCKLFYNIIYTVQCVL